MSDAPPVDETLTLLGDEYVRENLIATRSELMTATTLADEVDAAESIVSDRIDDLHEPGYLSKITRTDERGNDYAEYRTRRSIAGVFDGHPMDGWQPIISDGIGRRLRSRRNGRLAARTDHSTPTAATPIAGNRNRYFGPIRVWRHYPDYVLRLHFHFGTAAF